MMVGDASKPAVPDVLLCQIILCFISCYPFSGSPTPWKETAVETVNTITNRCIEFLSRDMSAIDHRQHVSRNLSGEVTRQLIGTQMTGIRECREDHLFPASS